MHTKQSCTCIRKGREGEKERRKNHSRIPLDP